MNTNKYSNKLISSTGTEIDLTEIEKTLSDIWYKWKSHSMTKPSDKKQMKRDIIELIDIMLD